MQLKEIFTLLAYLSPAILLWGIVQGIISFSRLNTLARCILFYFVGALIFHFSAKIAGIVFKNNLIFFPLYAIFELVLFAYLYLKILSRKSHKVLIWSLTITGLAYIVYECITIDFMNKEDFQSYARSVDAFFVVIFAMLYFFDKLSIGTDPKDSILSLNTIILVFFSLNLIFLLPLNFLISETGLIEHKIYFWFGNLALTVLYYLFLIRWIWKNGKTPIR